MKIKTESPDFIRTPFEEYITSPMVREVVESIVTKGRLLEQKAAGMNIKLAIELKFVVDPML